DRLHRRHRVPGRAASLPAGQPSDDHGRGGCLAGRAAVPRAAARDVRLRSDQLAVDGAGGDRLPRQADPVAARHRRRPGGGDQAGACGVRAVRPAPPGLPGLLGFGRHWGGGDRAGLRGQSQRIGHLLVRWSGRGRRCERLHVSHQPDRSGGAGPARYGRRGVDRRDRRGGADPARAGCRRRADQHPGDRPHAVRGAVTVGFPHVVVASLGVDRSRRRGHGLRVSAGLAGCAAATLRAAARYRIHRGDVHPRAVPPAPGDAGPERPAGRPRAAVDRDAASARRRLRDPGYRLDRRCRRRRTAGPAPRARERAGREGAARRMKPHVVPAVAAGGAVGSLARYSVSSAFPHPPGEFPWSTLLVNVTGCLLIGVLMAVLATQPDPHPLLRPFLGIGVLGGYTTFSTYAVEVVDTAQTGAVLALLYATATILLALSATAAGHRVTRTLLQ